MNEQLLVTLERLRDDLTDFRKEIRSKYPSDTRQVTSDELRKKAAALAETWMVEVATANEVSAIEPGYVADLNVHFQRLLTISEHASRRSVYETEVGAVLRKFSTDLLIPLKQMAKKEMASHTSRTPTRVAAIAVITAEEPFSATAFVGLSFSDKDKIVNTCVIDTLLGLGVHVLSGEKPKAEKISEKIKARIEAQHIFVGVFTRRDRLAGKTEWTTSPWVIDEKAYAFGRGKKLILLKEVGVGSIGGIQGDYELINFDRKSLQTIPLAIARLFELKPSGFSPE